MKLETPEQLKKETKKRIAKMRKEFALVSAMKGFENSEKYDQMVVQTGIPFMAVCEHHEVGFFGKAHVGYIVGKYLLGLSKLSRLVETYFNPTVKTLQERGTQEIADTLQAILNPQGVMVVVTAQHGCVSYRGVKKPSTTITSAVSGVFKDYQSGARQEFLELVKLGEKL